MKDWFRIVINVLWCLCILAIFLFCVYECNKPRTVSETKEVHDTVYVDKSKLDSCIEDSVVTGLVYVDRDNNVHSSDCFEGKTARYVRSVDVSEVIGNNSYYFSRRDFSNKQIEYMSRK